MCALHTCVFTSHWKIRKKYENNKLLSGHFPGDLSRALIKVFMLSQKKRKLLLFYILITKWGLFCESCWHSFFKIAFVFFSQFLISPWNIGPHNFLIFAIRNYFQSFKSFPALRHFNTPSLEPAKHAETPGGNRKAVVSILESLRSELSWRVPAPPPWLVVGWFGVGMGGGEWGVGDCRGRVGNEVGGCPLPVAGWRGGLESIPGRVVVWVGAGENCTDQQLPRSQPQNLFRPKAEILPLQFDQ